MGANDSMISASQEGRLPADWRLASFDITPRTRLVFGNGSVNRLGLILEGLSSRRVLLVTDPGIVRAGHAERVHQALSADGRESVVFSRVRENPDTDCVDECLAVARDFRPDVIVGLGGGSSMDTAKGCNFLLTNGGRMQDYWGVGKATRPMLPFIAIPTTAGTGSECQSAALISDATTHQKMACLDPKAAAYAALLDPELTVSQPAGVTACTGIDAVAHAVETAVTAKRNPVSSMYSREAFALLVPSLPVVLQNPGHLEARGRMLLGAAFAGMAIEQSMLGAAHSAANPLTAHCGVIHGVAVGLMLPHVVRFNAADPQVRPGVRGISCGGRSGGAGCACRSPGGGPDSALGSIAGCGIHAEIPEALRRGFPPGSHPGARSGGAMDGPLQSRPDPGRGLCELYEAALAGR
jgi:alcohol dehydrogenase